MPLLIKRPLPPAHKKIVTAWVIALVGYVALTFFTQLSFDWLSLSTISNAFLILLIWTEFKQQDIATKVDDAVAYLQVSNGKIVLGEKHLQIEKVNKLVLDIQDDIAYCSFPFNQPKPGVVLSFCFPKEQLDALKQHIQSALPKVKIIEEHSD